MPGVKVIEDLLLEILQPHAHTDAAGAAQTEHHVPLREFRPFAEEPRRFERDGKRAGGFRAPCHRSLAAEKSRSFASLRMTTL